MRISDWSSDVCSSDLKIAASSANTVNPLELDIARSISGLFGPDEVPDPDAIAKLLFSEQSQAIEQEISLAKSKLLAPIVSAYIAAHPEIGRASCRERVCQYV